MNNIKKTLALRTKKTALLWATLLSTLIALDVYFFLLHPIIFRKRDLLLAGLIWLALLPLLFLLFDRFLLPRLQNYSSHAQRNWFLLTLAVGILSSLVIRPSLPFTLLLPIHSLRVNIPPGSADRVITLEWVSTEFGDVSFDSIPQQGNWVRYGNILTFTGPDPASLTWSGRPGSFASLFFSDSPAVKEILIGWDGHLSPPDTSHIANDQVPLSFSFPTAWPATLAPRILIGLTSAFFFLLLTLFLLGVQLKPANPVTRKKGYWLIYSLPMIVVWGIFLLTFWPGMMSTDSNVQWQQVVAGQFSDAHPVFHTLFIWLITRIWFTPAAVAIVQIIALSLTVSWGINILDDQGLPPWAAWTLAALFALSPVNGDMVIILWKDIPYSTSLFLLSLMILKIVFSQGRWLAKQSTWVWLALVSLCVASFRHNGLPIPFLTLPILILVYKKWWKPLVSSLVLFFALYLLIHGPLYDLLKVNRSVGSLQQIFVHHIAAHIVTGGPLTPQQQSVADQIIDPGQWVYDCCVNVPTMLSTGYSDYKNSQISNEINRLAFQLAINEPWIELSHQVCISSLVWELPGRCGAGLHAFLPYSAKSWIQPKFNKAVYENSQLPFLLPFTSSLLIRMKGFSSLSLLIQPSFYLFLLLLCTSIATVRKKDPWLLLFMLPSVFQSLFLTLVNTSSSDFRYQYGVMLAGAFSLGLLILALCSPPIIQPRVNSEPGGKI